jgi:hypothetical protein
MKPIHAFLVFWIILALFLTACSATGSQSINAAGSASSGPVRTAPPLAHCVEITPRDIRLAGAPGEVMTGRVRVIPRPGCNFTITTAAASRGEYVTFELAPLNPDRPVEGYLLSVTVARPTPGVVAEFINLTTDHPDLPLIKISARAMVRAAGTARGSEAK